MMNLRGQMPRVQPGTPDVNSSGTPQGAAASTLQIANPNLRTSLASPVQPQRPFGQIGMPPVRSPLNAVTL